uniref:Uncharacterized protein n=1 Tax=Myripristis murdjan TaxID=586833 RepID=A0A668AIZ0_9TELE
MCVCVSDALMKALSHEPQLNGRSPRCCRSWSFRCDLCLKAFSHIWHPKGLSLLCTRSCLLRSGPRMKALPHTTQSPSRGCGGLCPCWCCSCAAGRRASPPGPCRPSPSGWRPGLASRGRRAPGSPGSSCWSAPASGCTGYPGS